MIQHDVSLRGLNTLRLEALADRYVEITQISDCDLLPELVAQAPRFFILGGGSNIILAASRIPLVLHVGLKGIHFQDVGEDVLVTAFAGESWGELVDQSVARGLYGIECLALIPGQVGAAPVQNIGAYGQEIGDSLESVDVFDLQTGQSRRFSKGECDFSYRNSRFKKSRTKNELILSVTLRLSRKPSPPNSYLQSLQGPELSAQVIAEEIKKIRRRKLPDPLTQPNVGSFFLNPVVSAEKVDELRAKSFAPPTFPQEGGFKIPAAWLIETAGLKAYRRGDVGVSELHSLVLVNYAAPTAAPLLELAREVRDKVWQKFGIELRVEPVIEGDFL